MSLSRTAKSAELQVMIWLLEAGWEVFIPIADTNATDAVVKEPVRQRLFSIQIKHKEPGKKNEGMLRRTWDSEAIPFDYLILYQPEKTRGIIAPKRLMKKKGKQFEFFERDTENYSNGKFRLMWRPYAFDLASVKIPLRAFRFAARFLSIIQKEANKAPEPTPPSVTSPAVAGAAPAGVVAQL